MSRKTDHRPGSDAKEGGLTPEVTQRILHAFVEKLDATRSASLNACVRCGLCAQSCHYSLTHDEVEAIPAWKVNLVGQVFRKRFTLAGKLFPALTGARELDEAVIAEWVDSLFGRCTQCGRCSLNCSIGLNIPAIVRAARGALAAGGLVPADLQSTVDLAVNTGNNMGIEKDEWVETVEWLADELRGETGDPEAAIPLDKAGAEILYTVNPREPKFFPLSLLAAAKVFHAMGADWTLSSEHFDLTNYGLFSGDDRASAEIARRWRAAAEQLGVKVLALGECGHGFAANRWEAPEWLGQEAPFQVISVLEIWAAALKAGKFRLDPSRNPQRVTLHDPCNLVRHGGVMEPQRELIRAAVMDFVEMTPNRENNFCCGGGGGQLAMSRFAKRRLQAGRVKADQIARTGAKVVVAPCHNCIDQLTELSKEYKLDVAVRTVGEVLSDALVFPAAP